VGYSLESGLGAFSLTRVAVARSGRDPVTRREHVAIEANTAAYDLVVTL
jgi:hypothetical protein